MYYEVIGYNELSTKALKYSEIFEALNFSKVKLMGTPGDEKGKNKTSDSKHKVQWSNKCNLWLNLVFFCPKNEIYRFLKKINFFSFF